MIKTLKVNRFKRFESECFDIPQTGLTICAGPNSSGKSTLLHALAVWSFGVMVVRQFKGDSAVRAGYVGQGAGISSEDFTPINLPDLRHLWLDLKTIVEGAGGYSMSISATWDEDTGLPGLPAVERELQMSFSLVQDRLFVKAEQSNLLPTSKIPNVVYVPPVAGIDGREEFATAPNRRAMLGRGLAGAILRNYLYDLSRESTQKKEELKANNGLQRLRGKLLDEFKEADPWERLNKLARERFGFELKVEPFDPDFHTVLKVQVQPKIQVGNAWRNGGVARDLMVEGAGAQQWITVLVFALLPQTDVLLLDEPDAHLFTGLKLDLIEILESIASEETGPQILLASHATEILKRYPVQRIMDFGKAHPDLLETDVQRAALISGLGDEFSELIEKARSSRAILFVENDSDRRILEAIANTCDLGWPENLAVLSDTLKHGDRLKFYAKLSEAIDGLHSVSLRDRDHDLHLNQICSETLRQKGIKTSNYEGFLPVTWRRREIENYALVPSALVDLKGQAAVEEFWAQRGWAWPPNPEIEEHLMDVDVKAPLAAFLGDVTIEDFMKDLDNDEIHGDLQKVAKAICGMKL